MPTERFTIELSGCAPTPLAHYLKALGILRLVSEQVDADAKGWWKNDTFWLRSMLDHGALVEFFLERYRSTPLVAPWNGGSGFYDTDNQKAFFAILNGTAARFSGYREVITLCRSLLSSLKLSKKPDSDQKAELLRLCRNHFPDGALRWLDAAFILTEDGPKYPPLLGTGGNDGRLEFTNNFMQRMCELVSPLNGLPMSGSRSALRGSLFDIVDQTRVKSPIGQFDPGSTGGANAVSGYDADSRINIWDYVLMLEGAIGFAAASVKKLEHAGPGILAYPFCVQSAGVGYGSADVSDEATSRNEMWMPLWDQPAGSDEVTALLAEGRVEVHGRRVRNSVDFARSIAALGTDRGIKSFERYGFQQRNGLAFFAVPLGRFHVRGVPAIEELLAIIDSWLDRFRRVANSDKSPARAARALRRIETAILELCQHGAKRNVQDVLIALGEAEAAISISSKLREPKDGKNKVDPVPLLSSEWLAQAYWDGDVEFRLAATLASIGYGEGETVGPFRRHLEPVDVPSLKFRFPKWSKTAHDPNIVWGGGGLVRNLIAVLQRRLIEALRHGKQKEDDALLFPGKGCCNASLGDIAAFIDGDVDDSRIEALLRGLILINWRYVGKDVLRQFTGNREPTPDVAYALLKLCHLSDKLDDKDVPLQPAITRRAIAGDLAAASRLAVRRLRGSGFSPVVDVVTCRGERAGRTAAALLFPVSAFDAKHLAETVLRPKVDDPSPTETAESVETTV